MSKVTVNLPAGPGRALVPLALGGALLAAMIGWLMFTTTIGPDQVAVRQVVLGPSKGIQKDPIGPGTHIVVPGVERLHLFPRGLKVLEFNDDPQTAAGGARVQPAIRIQTSEGYQVTVDVAIAYRVVDPARVISAVGPGSLYESALMIPRSDKVLRQKLGELNAEDFYSGPKRRSHAEDARALLQSEVKDAGIEVWAVMVRHYTYDQRYQEAIEQRKIQDQTVFKNRAEAVAASQEAEKDRVLAEGEATIEVERERGRSDVKRIQAEAESYSRRRIAEAELLVALAEAEGTRLENAALQAAGAGNLVGLEMAEVMKGAEIIVVPTDGAGAVNPLDLESLLRGW